MSNHYFRIADHHICIRLNDSDSNVLDLIPSFKPFCMAEEPEGVLFTLTVDAALQPVKGRKLIRNFDTGNGETAVYQLPDGGYQYIVRNIFGNDCCLLVTNERFTESRCALNGDWTMRSFGLNNALMLVFAFAGSFYQTMLVHASCIMTGNTAYPFIAQSGTGKSTHSSLWMKYIEGVELLNDDNPIIRIGDDGQPYIYGSPWSGKTPCYRNRKAYLGAVTRIERAPQNSIERLGPVQAFASLLPACSSMKWDTTIYDNLCEAVTRLIETTPIYTLYCRPDEEAARICYASLVMSDE